MLTSTSLFFDPSRPSSAVRLGGDLSIGYCWLNRSWPLGSHQEVLSSSEVDKAGTFAFERDRDQYVRSHIFLRYFLAEYLDSGINPGVIDFFHHESGKPLVRDASIDFSLSHTDGLAVALVSASQKVGIDAERIEMPVDDMLDYRKLADRFYTPREREFIRTTSEPLVAAYNYIWTRKEALAKAMRRNTADLLEYVDVLPTDKETIIDGFHVQSYFISSQYCVSMAVGGLVDTSDALAKSLVLALG